MAKSNKETGVVLPDCAAPETPLTAEELLSGPKVEVERSISLIISS
jgi:hypothetical protein